MASTRTVSLLAALCAVLSSACDYRRDAEGPATAADRASGAIALQPLLLISIDGFRHDYMEMAELPALEKLAEDGLKADSLQHVFPTKTFTTHYALATGLYAENTGVVANNMWDPKRKARFSLGNRDAVSDGYWYDGEPIWNTVEKAGGIAATYFWPGSEAQIGGIRPSLWKPYAGETPHDTRVDQVLEWLDLPEDRRPDFLTLYFSAVDSAGHAHGPAHPKTMEAAVEVDRALARLLDGLEQRGLYGEMHILVTSDHGMQQIDLNRYVLLDDFLDLGEVNVSDWGPAAQIWAVEGGPDAEQIFQALDGAHAAFRRVWKKGQGPERYRFDDHQRVPDVTVEAKPGWMISNKPYYAGMQRGVLNGMHGWDPAWHKMHGLFIANGPAFEPGERIPAVRSVDLYSLMARLMDVPPAPTDGSIAAFEPLLNSADRFTVTETRWKCAETAITTRTVPGLTALHHQGLVFALPQIESASGARFADAGVEFWNNGAAARIEIEGRVFPECTQTEKRDAS